MNNSRYCFLTFKRDINLTTFASMFYGYEIDKKKSTKSSIAMKSTNDKVIISKKSGMWVYFSVFDESDSGTIIDFIANRTNKSISEIGQHLSEWLGLCDLKIPAYQVKDQSYDRNRVRAIFEKCRPIDNSEYLENRGLGNDLLQSDRFRGRVFVDRYGNLVFPHFLSGKVCGIELKNTERGLLVKGSQKTFWRSNVVPKDNALVITEAVIDALSYQAIYNRKNTMYLATGGGVSANQCSLLTDMLKAKISIKRVVVATDNDDGGDRIAKRVLKSVRQSGYPGKIIRHNPSNVGGDWNDELLNKGKRL
ncbi:MAG: toprim domain-containing protein [Planctomycetota bacterium]